MHTKRTGHTEFTDKTSETVKPISLEAPKVDAMAEDPIGATTDQNEGKFHFFSSGLKLCSG